MMADNNDGGDLGAKKRKKEKAKTIDENDSDEVQEKRLKQDGSARIIWTDEIDHNLLELVEDNCNVLRRKGTKFIFVKNVKWQSVAERLSIGNKIEVKAVEVRNRWEEITKKIRKFRTVPEMMEDLKQNLTLGLDTKPRKPMTSYLYFCNSKRARISEKYPGLSFADLQKRLGKKWREMPAEKKQKYEKKALKEKQRYGEELKQWQQVHPEAFIPLENGKRRDSVPTNQQKIVTPFDIFVKKKSPELMVKYSDISSADLEEKLNRRWEKLKEQKREKYIKEAKNINDELKKNLDTRAKINKKTKRDPAMPKKPPTAYILYCQEQREILLQRSPDLDFGSLSKLNSQGWKDITTEDSTKYHERAKVLKEEYLQKLAEFQNKKDVHS